VMPDEDLPFLEFQRGRCRIGVRECRCSDGILVILGDSRSFVAALYFVGILVFVLSPDSRVS
jgi:hypothetical protein